MTVLLIGMLSKGSLLHLNCNNVDELSVYCEDIYNSFPASLFLLLCSPDSDHSIFGITISSFVF